MIVVLILVAILPYNRVGTHKLLGYGIIVITPYNGMVWVYSIFTVIV